MKEGTRKFKAWLITEMLVTAIFGFSLGSGVQFDSGSITTIILIVSSLSAAFFGANTFEHKYADYTKKD